MLKARSLLHQFAAAMISSLSIFSAGGSYVWPATLIYRLTQPNPYIYLTSSDVALIVSIIEIATCVSPIPSAYLSNMLGRKVVLLTTAPFHVVGALLPLVAKTVPALVIMRFLQGMANGAIFTILPLYLGELAEPKLRGAVSVIFTVFFFLGMLLTFIVGKHSNFTGVTWLILAEPILFTILFIFMPETPHFLILNNKQEKALESLKYFRGAASVEDVRTELKDIANEVKKATSTSIHSAEQIRGLAGKPWRELFMTKVGRKALLLAHIVVVTQVVGGFFSVFSYAADTLSQYMDEKSNVDGILVSIIFTVVTIVVTLVSLFLVDILGRRAMLLTSSIMSAIFSSLCTSYFFMVEKTDIIMVSYVWVLYASLILLASALSFALGALLPTLQSELFSTTTRSLASGFITTTQSFITFVMLYIYFPFCYANYCFVNYLIFALALAMGSWFIYTFFPETKGKTFAEIQKGLS